jgi:catalase
LVPVQKIGRLVLDRNPDNFFAETEQVAYCPANIVPGIDFTNDPLLQGRLFSYLDTQKSRLGTANFHQLPINAPKCPVMNFQRDGHMQMNVPQGRANYEPNSLAAHGEIGGPRECPVSGFATVPGREERDEQGDKLRVRAELFADHYSQPRLFWKSMTDNERAHIASAFTFELSKVGLAQVPPRMVANLRNVDEELAQRVAAGLGIELPAASKPARAPVDMQPSAALSIQNNMRETLEGRAVGILFADGSDGKEIERVRAAVTKAGAKAILIAPKVGGAKLADGTMLKADGQLLGTPSQTVDAIAVVLSADGTSALLNEGAAVQFVMDAFGHLKAIGATAEAKPLLDKAGVQPDAGITGLGSDFIDAAAKRFFEREPKVRMLA